MKLCPERLKSLARGNVSTLFAILAVGAVRSSIVEPFKIPSGSMLPTLYVGDFILVNKFAYGFHLPFSRLFGDAHALIDRAPAARGDIVVFEYPRDRSLHYIKRVIGVPGDVIEVKDKVVTVNGQPLSQDELGETERAEKIRDIGDERYASVPLRLRTERIGEREHRILTDASNASTNHFGPITVPPESLFMMGDNRDFSNDSRYWGFVPYENVTGRAETVWMSMWINLAQAGEDAFRPERIGISLN